MSARINVVIVGYSTFSWELAAQLKGQIDGRLYFVLPDWDQAMEASLQGDVVAVRGEITLNPLMPAKRDVIASVIPMAK